MNRFLLLIGMVLLPVLGLPAASPADSLPPLDTVLRAVEKRYTAAQFSAEFLQESTIRAMEITDFASGRIYVRYPGMMRWEYEKPEPQAIITDGQKLWVYRPQDNQVLTGSAEELQRGGRFLQSGFTQGQAKLKAVWENQQIASICSQMPSMALLSENTAAAVNKTRLSALDREALSRYAQASAAGYCAGCTRICESAVAAPVPVGRVMRYLMYCRDYGKRDFARSRVRALPQEARAALARLDYTTAEARCPQKMPIGRLMREASLELA